MMLATGASVRDIAEEMGTSQGTVYYRLTKNEEVKQRYRDAQGAKAAKVVDEILDIADNPWIPAEDKRIMVDARKWIGGAFLSIVANNGVGGGSPVQVNVNDADKRVQIVVGTPKPVKADKKEKSDEQLEVNTSR